MGDNQEKRSAPVKYDWYQTEATVVITILAKNVNSDTTAINFTNDTVSVNLSLPDNCTHAREIRVAHDVNPDQCTFKVTQTKVEVKLKKAEGIRWEHLERSEDDKILKQIPQDPSASSGPPSYPTSKPGKDWTAIERDINKQESSEKPVGEEALNMLFQDIYGKGSDDVKRAMVKSYMESGGTVLSTNWNEIGKGHVDVKPPDGMEWKKWDS
ncbi:hypothetical protein PPYR_12780 [Photinus pyralis]|uniref:CS domain-containing protein n=1 Tax=Photinus pyralis TaxID=7054 RepID=A0A1Y1MUY8_PHOPY|nr:protein SGT1 homolog [Photinus pyralis]XP_031353995.1 protein SGT1 homolog [Photinus pyralis]KAB0791203.1 hypothetical protein PPYR_03003 [Photinus pyralis]KAB0793160.1 hypothetical protein PPYR_12780 [Photinus pyralis]